MRLGSAQRRRSWAWRGVILVALLTIGAYVLFDILDVDGSRMTARPAGDMIVAEALQAEADRVLRADTITPDSTGLHHPSLSRWSTTERHRLSFGTLLLRIRQRRMLPRVDLHRALTQTRSLSADPV
jgi:hypothetical protein